MSVIRTIVSENCIAIWNISLLSMFEFNQMSGLFSSITYTAAMSAILFLPLRQFIVIQVSSFLLLSFGTSLELLLLFLRLEGSDWLECDGSIPELNRYQLFKGLITLSTGEINITGKCSLLCHALSTILGWIAREYVTYIYGRVCNGFIHICHIWQGAEKITNYAEILEGKIRR